MRPQWRESRLLLFDTFEQVDFSDVNRVHPLSGQRGEKNCASLSQIGFACIVFVYSI